MKVPERRNNQQREHHYWCLEKIGRCLNLDFAGLQFFPNSGLPVFKRRRTARSAWSLKMAP
jgi:hypothetical protein